MAASLAGRRGVVRISPEAQAELFLSGPDIVGLAFHSSLSVSHHQRSAVSRGCRHRGPSADYMNAEIIAVGSELLTPQRVDTNSLWLTERLNALGVEVVTKTIVGDDRERLAALFSAALSRSGIVILSGGLGPTEDDVTRDAVAQALGREAGFPRRYLRGDRGAVPPHGARHGRDQQAAGVGGGRRAKPCRIRAAPLPGCGSTGRRESSDAAAGSAARVEADVRPNTASPGCARCCRRCRSRPPGSAWRAWGNRTSMR